MVTINTVYIIAIIAIALVVAIVSLAYVGRLKSGRLTVKKNAIEMKMDAQPDRNLKSDQPSPHLQSGKTVIDEDLLVNSGIDAPADADLKIRKTKAFGSPITIHEPGEEGNKDHVGH
jgi:hypothetical protein